jgi:hypothetical protein
MKKLILLFAFITILVSLFSTIKTPLLGADYVKYEKQMIDSKQLKVENSIYFSK